MKVNLLDRGRRWWLFHLSIALLFTCATIPTCQSGALLTDSSSTKLPEKKEIPQHQQVTTSTLPSSLKRLLQGSYTSNAFLSQAFNKVFEVPNLSESCSRDVSRFVGQIMTLVGHPSEGNAETTVENWALQMLDAWAKPPEGILSGHVNALGDFDECLAVRAPAKENTRVNQFQGKYCLVYTVPNVSIADASTATPKSKVQHGERSIDNLLKILNIVGKAELPLIPSVGSCFPSTCSDQEILEIVRALFATINLVPVTTFCSVDEPQKIGSGAIATISLLVVLVILVIIGTLIELAINSQYIPNTFSKTKLGSVFYAFSLISNGRKFLNTDTSPNDVNCLHGIRFLSASWVVLGHTYLMGIMQALWNIVDTYSMITTSLSMVVIVNAAIVVDVFFVIGGFLVSLTLLVMLEKSKGKMNLPLLYAHRYLRITPLYIVIILVGTFIFPLLGSGPYWHVAKTWAGFCEKNWWKNVLYINNLPIYNTMNDPTDNPCHGMAWYLGVDMQLFLLSPFLLFPVWKWKRYGSIPLILLTITSIIIPGVLTYVNGYAPTSIPFGDRESKYSQEAYTPTYMRATPYLVGMCTGLLFYTIRNTAFKLSRSVVVGAWMVAFAVGFAVLFAPHKFLNPEYVFQPGESAIYVSGQRTAWSLAVSWLIFACGTGYGGWINQILSWRPFVPLGRLTFAIYLVSMHLQFLFHLQYRQPIYFTNYHMVNLYFGHLVMSCLVALVFTMLVEAPFMQLLKLVMPTGKRSTANASNDSNNNNDYKEADISVVSERERCSISPVPSEGSTRSNSPDQIPSGYGSAGSQAQLVTV